MSATEVIKTVLPWIGTALGGPLAPLIAGLVASKLDIPKDSVESTITSMLGKPEEVARLKQIEAEVQIKLMELGYKNIETLAGLEVQNVVAVNETMRAETTAEHWPQYSWRPFNGFLFAITIFVNYCLLPVFDKPSSNIPEWVFVTWGGILGLASFWRGKMQADPNIPTATKIIK